MEVSLSQVCFFFVFRGAVLSGAYAREYAADPYIGHSIGPVAGYGVCKMRIE